MSSKYRFALIFILCTAVTDVATAQSGNYSTEAVEKLNLKFRELYAAARAERLAKAGPTIIAKGDSLVLLRGGERAEGSRVSPHYHDLKTISHVPLAVYCAVSSHLNKPIDEQHSKPLREFLMLIKQVRESLATVFEQAEIRTRQDKLLNRCESFTKKVLSEGVCSDAALDQFIDDIRPGMLQNVEDATRLRIDNYHSQMKIWRKQLNAGEWAQLHVVIPGAALPRRNSAAVQYFSKLLQERGEGKRVIYAESQFEESKDLQLLGTHLLDAQVGAAFFGDPWRMQRDLLGSAADSYLDTLDFDDIRDSR